MNAKRHHFVPQGFLRGFAADGEATPSFIWVYDKRQGRAPSKKAIRSIAWADAYYALERDDGSQDLNTLESALARDVDNKIPPIIHALAPIPGRIVSMNETNKSELAFFIGLALARVPSFRDGINKMYSQIAQITLNALGQHEPELGLAIERYGISATAKDWVSLEPMLQVAEAVAESVLEKQWQFFIPPPEVPLITSDNPVLFSSNGLPNVGPAHPDAEIVINLKKNLSLVCTPKRGYASMMAFKLSPTDARKFNRGIARSARHRVFASHFSLVMDEFVKKQAGFEQRIVV